MPVTKSAEKRVRQNIKRYRRNLKAKQRVKSDIRSLIESIASGNAKTIAERLNKAQSSVDKAAKNKIIHKNKAARIKSSLAKKAAAKPKPNTATSTTKPKVKTANTQPKAKASAKPKTKAATKTPKKA